MWGPDLDASILLCSTIFSFLLFSTLTRLARLTTHVLFPAHYNRRPKNASCRRLCSS